MNKTYIIIYFLYFIILFLMVGGIILYFFKSRNKTLKNNDGQTDLNIRKYSEQYFTYELTLLFKEWKDLYGRTNDSRISDLNKDFRKRLLKIINLKEFKYIKNTKDSLLYEEVIFIEKLLRVSPFVWFKKYGDEIEKYYGQ